MDSSLPSQKKLDLNSLNIYIHFLALTTSPKHCQRPTFLPTHFQSLSSSPYLVEHRLGELERWRTTDDLHGDFLDAENLEANQDNTNNPAEARIATRSPQAPITCEGDLTSLNLPFLEGLCAHMKLQEDYLSRNISQGVGFILGRLFRVKNPLFKVMFRNNRYAKYTF